MRPSPFTRKGVYELLQDFGITAPNASFGRGQMVRYLRCVGYSHWDGASVYAFENVQTGERQEYWWFDDDPPELVSARLRLLS